MARKRCCGMIELQPCSRRFCPEPDNLLPRIEVGMEELEAIRLKDLEGKEQVECAEIMKLSRPTFQRVLYSAHAKIALALVEGREICIKGGNYIQKERNFQCLSCNEIWSAKPCAEGGEQGFLIPCPSCGSMEKVMLAEDGSRIPCLGRPCQEPQTEK